MSYVDDAISAGIPVDAIQRFLAANPGDDARLIAALGSDYASAPRATLASVAAARSFEGGSSRQSELDAFLAANPGDIGRAAAALGFSVDDLSRDQIGRGIVDSGAMAIYAETIDPQRIEPKFLSAVVPFIPAIASAIGGFFGRGDSRNVGTVPIVGGDPSYTDLVNNIVSKLPLPKPGTGIAVRQPTTITIPKSGGMRGVNLGKLAKAAAAAAALGISVEEYLRLNPGAVRTTRRMNVLNPKALRKGMRRVEGFASFAKRTMQFADCHQLTGRKRRHKAGCGCATCKRR